VRQASLLPGGDFAAAGAVPQDSFGALRDAWMRLGDLSKAPVLVPGGREQVAVRSWAPRGRWQRPPRSSRRSAWRSTWRRLARKA